MNTEKAEKLIIEKLHPLEIESVLAEIITMISESGQAGCFDEIYTLLESKGLL